MKKIVVQALLLLFLLPVMAHYKARYHVIVDTDGGDGDMRSLCMMLADPEIEVIAVTAVQGTLSPRQTINQVKDLLRSFGHEGIPVGGTTVAEASGMILHETEMEEMPVDIVALGSLDNMVAAMEKMPDWAEKIRAIYWAPGGSGTEEMFAEGGPSRAFPRLELVRTMNEDRVDLKSFLEGLDVIGSRYAAALSAMMQPGASPVKEPKASFQIREEAVPLFMLHPALFEQLPGQGPDRPPVARLRGDIPVVSSMLEMLDGEQADRSILFVRFPTDTALFLPDVKAIASEILKQHGEKEWKIVALTNEFHEHLGIYAILGAKMGLRAREYFHVGIDELTILSFAGHSPPLSCMNDGLQVSTGATLGHGTIEVSTENLSPQAVFRFKDRQLKLSVKEEVRKRVREEVKHGVDTFGFETPEYWEYIRTLALKYWLEYSRFDIFDMEGSF